MLPWFGGAALDAPDRRLRLVSRPERAGWWRFSIEGRNATPLGPAEPEGLDALPRVRGHLLPGPRLVTDDALAEQVSFAPPEEPLPLAPASCRRWPGGQLLFDGLDFGTEAEEEARRALEEGRGLQGVKHVPASLRAAFGYALAEARARARGMAIEPLELRTRIAALAEGGPAAINLELERIEAERRARHTAWTPPRAVRVSAPVRVEDAQERAGEALRAAGAELIRARQLDPSTLEVVYRFLGTRFVSIVDPRTLQVLDAGICLSGEDHLVTLESLPGVIREGANTGRLVILRRPD